MRKIFNAVWLVGFFWAFLAVNSLADENSEPTPRANPVDTGSVSEKLDRVIATQDEILRQLGEIKAEVEVTKIRASQR